MDEEVRVAGLDGRVALVTGGASGLGRATCVALAAQGVHVVAGDIDEADPSRIAKIEERIAELERGESRADRRADCEAGNRREIDEWASNLVRLLNESGIPFPPRPHLRNCNIDREET